MDELIFAFANLSVGNKMKIIQQEYFSFAIKITSKKLYGNEGNMAHISLRAIFGVSEYECGLSA